jgi:hypothetical protein
MRIYMFVCVSSVCTPHMRHAPNCYCLQLSDYYTAATAFVIYAMHCYSTEISYGDIAPGVCALQHMAHITQVSNINEHLNLHHCNMLFTTATNIHVQCDVHNNAHCSTYYLYIHCHYTACILAIATSSWSS